MVVKTNGGAKVRRREKKVELEKKQGVPPPTPWPPQPTPQGYLTGKKMLVTERRGGQAGQISTLTEKRVSKKGAKW